MQPPIKRQFIKYKILLLFRKTLELQLNKLVTDNASKIAALKADVDRLVRGISEVVEKISDRFREMMRRSVSV